MKSLLWLLEFVRVPKVGIFGLLVLAATGLPFLQQESKWVLACLGLVLLVAAVLVHAYTPSPEAKLSPPGTPPISKVPYSEVRASNHSGGASVDIRGLTEANMTLAILTSTDLTRADLTRASLADICLEASTIWPSRLPETASFRSPDLCGF